MQRPQTLIKLVFQRLVWVEANRTQRVRDTYALMGAMMIAAIVASVAAVAMAAFSAFTGLHHHSAVVALSELVLEFVLCFSVVWLCTNLNRISRWGKQAFKDREHLKRTLVLIRRMMMAAIAASLAILVVVCAFAGHAVDLQTAGYALIGLLLVFASCELAIRLISKGIYKLASWFRAWLGLDETLEKNFGTPRLAIFILGWGTDPAKRPPRH